MRKLDFILLFLRMKDFAWRNNPKTLIASTMKNLYHMTMSDAVRPAESSSLVAVQIDKFGSVAFAVGVEGLWLFFIHGAFNWF
jgi:hypothetical protein